MRWRRHGPVDILVVCTGNVCRSPYVAARLQHDLREYVVASAGTGALTGAPPTEQTCSLLVARGVTEPVSTARQVSSGLIKASHLIITATAAHRVQVARLHPAAAERTFTLRELARAVDSLDKRPRGAGLVGVIDIGRSAAQQDSGHDFPDDLDDPFGGTDFDYDRMAVEVETALAVIVPALHSGESA